MPSVDIGKNVPSKKMLKNLFNGLYGGNLIVGFGADSIKYSKLLSGFRIGLYPLIDSSPVYATFIRIDEDGRPLPFPQTNNPSYEVAVKKVKEKLRSDATIMMDYVWEEIHGSIYGKNPDVIDYTELYKKFEKKNR